MGVPFEALIPYGIMIGLFGVSGGALAFLKKIQNGGKRPRHSIDQWDRQSTSLSLRNLTRRVIDLDIVMDRDRRLTGFLRGQTDNPAPPTGFELNNPWRLEKRII